MATISRYVRKIVTTDIKTAGVCYDRNNDDIVLMINPRWFNFLMTQPDGEKRVGAVLTHEFYHLIFDHLGSRRREPHNFWNIATDAAINSIIESNGGVLPWGLILPGTAPTTMGGDAVVIEPGSLQDVLMKMPKGEASEWYFNRLMEEAKKNGWPTSGGKIRVKIKVKGEAGTGVGSDPSSGDYEIEIDMDSTDDHNGWDDIPEEEREFITEKVKQIVERAVRHADQCNGWGNVPSELREQIRRFVNTEVDWRSLLRQFIGRTLRGNRALSIKKINKKYPYIHPGSKRGYIANIIVAIDQSGSVGTDALELFFAELTNLSRKVTFTILPFDHTVAEDQMFVWKKGTSPKLERVRCGGTDFDAATTWVNDVKRRGKFQGLIYCTDGECSKPSPSRVKRAWVVCPDHKLMFETDETVINLSKDPPKSAGPWR